MSTHDETPPAVADLEASGAFLTASRALVGISVRSLGASPVEITLTQHRLLVLVAAEGEQTIGSLAQHLGVNQSNASRLVARLQRLGLLDRQRSRSDDRAVAVTLHPAGREVLDAVSRHRREEIEALLGAMSPAERAAATLGMTAFNRAAHERADDDWVGP